MNGWRIKPAFRPLPALYRGGSEQAQDLFSFYDDTISRLLDGLAP